jgi:hypothetical protein
MDKNLRIFFYGFLVWLIPFLVSWPLYSPKGEPLYDLQVIKSFLIVVGSLVGALLAIRYFRDTEKDFAKEGAILGFSWLVINSVLDIIVLVYLLKGMDILTWAGQIGIRYLVMPIMTIAMGVAMEMRGKE